MELLGPLLIALLLNVVHSTKFHSCKGQIHGKLSSLSISDCDGKQPCTFQKGTHPTVEVHFNPNNDIKKLRNKAFVKIKGVTVPFLGIDGKSVCKKIYNADGTTPAGCPLKANTDYVYKTTFHVNKHYPQMDPQLHWALQDASNSQDVICFEIQAEVKS